MATALSILNASFADCGITSANESLSADLSQDGLRRLNNMVASWRTQYGTVTAIERNVFPLTANQQTYTIGLGGQFNVPRPETISGAGLLLNGLDSPQTITSITRSGYTATVTLASHGFAVGDETLISGATQIAYNGLQTILSTPTSGTFTFTVEGTPTTPATGTLVSRGLADQPVEIPRAVITDDAYQAIQIKSLSNSLFTLVYYNPTYPFGTIWLWPLPDTDDHQLVLYLQNAFTGFADLTTEYEFVDVPGYAEALQYQLNLRLFTPYGVKDPGIIEPIRDMAAQSFGLIKRANNKLSDLPTDAQVLAYNRRAGYNIQSGQGG